jgi:hypothetical protein
MADILNLQLNIPEVIALEFSQGKPIPSKMPNGGTRLMFTLVDGRITFLPESVGDQLKEARIAPRVPFQICKRQVSNGKWNHVEYDIQTHNAASSVFEAKPTAPVRSLNESAKPGYIEEQRVQVARRVEAATAPASGAVSPRARRMMAAMVDAVDVTIETERYLERRGLDLQASFESVRALAATFFIQESKGGAA